MSTDRQTKGDLFQSWLEVQRNWMQFWGDSMSRFAGRARDTQADREPTTPGGAATDIYSQWWKPSQDMFQQLGKVGPGGLGQEVFERALGATALYAKLYEFWTGATTILGGTSPEQKPISQAYKEFCDSWLQTYDGVIQQFFTGPMFQPFKGLLGDATEIPRVYSDFLSKFFGPWMDAMSALPGTAAQAMRKGPQGYTDVHRLWVEAYEQTWGRVLRMPPLGLTRETIERLQSGTSALIDHYSATVDYLSALQRVGTQAMQNIANKLAEMHRKGEAPRTYGEFYTLWGTVNEEALHELFKTPEFSRLLGRVVETSMSLRKRFDDIMEENLKVLPIPTRSEMNDLYKSLYLLRKEVRKNTMKIRELEAKLAANQTAPVKGES